MNLVNGVPVEALFLGMLIYIGIPALVIIGVSFVSGYLVGKRGKSWLE